MQTSHSPYIATSSIAVKLVQAAAGFVGGQNLFKEFKDQLGKSGEKDWQPRGGHRLWIAPEDRVKTYAPDNGPVKVEVRDGVLEAIEPVTHACDCVRFPSPQNPTKFIEIRAAPVKSQSFGLAALDLGLIGTYTDPNVLIRIQRWRDPTRIYPRICRRNQEWGADD